MIETEGVCDDCNGAMQHIRDDIWYCPHCETYKEWHGGAFYYVTLDNDGDE